MPEGAELAVAPDRTDEGRTLPSVRPDRGLMAHARSGVGAGARATILAGAKQVAWNRDLDWIESDRASFWPRHVNDPLNGSLESTQGGRWLESLRVFHPDAPKKFSRDECKQLWCAAAEKMALQASGRVTIDVDEVIPGSVFQEVELPALKRNPGVTLDFVSGAVRKQPEDRRNTR